MSKDISGVYRRGDPCGRPAPTNRPYQTNRPENGKDSCVILAGGRSTRMGRNKALLPLPGKEHLTFVEHLASILTPLCSETILVARDPADAANYRLPGVQVVADKVPAQGPLIGLYSGLSVIHTRRALVVAVDMPFIQPALITFLLSQPQTNALLIPLVNNVPQVLLALYPRTILPLIEECIQQGRRDPRSLLRVAPVQYIEETQLRSVDPELRSFINVNTPEDL
jgi:molybdopterin-guanine dinucleotide biosynthesis protein A